MTAKVIEDTLLDVLIELITAYDAHSIKDLPGAWEMKIDNAWHLAVNGHPEDISVEPPGMMEVAIPPYHFCVWYNGWLAGLFHPTAGGEFLAGHRANEETFKAAVRRHVARLSGER